MSDSGRIGVEDILYETHRRCVMEMGEFHAIYNMMVLMAHVGIVDLDDIPADQKGTDYDLIQYVDKYILDKKKRRKQ